MGNLILCVGKKAETPFVFQDTQTEVYTLEEMCYYIYSNIDAITEGMFDQTMIEWLWKQKELQEVSKKMERLVENNNSLKDKVVTLLCGCDYYKEKEIRDLIVIMDQLEKMTPFERYKQRGNSLLEHGRYKDAETLYLDMLKPETAKQFSTEEYGDILHNLAVIHSHTASYGEAAKEFKAAFDRNQRRETLEQYFLALKLSGQKDVYEKEVSRLDETGEIGKKVEEELQQKMAEAEKLLEYGQLKRISLMKNQGKVSAYYESIDTMLEKWKKEYKEEAVG